MPFYFLDKEVYRWVVFDAYVIAGVSPGGRKKFHGGSGVSL